MFLNGFIDLLATDGKNNLVINPTLYSIFGKDGQLTDIGHHRQETFLRNISLTAGITPDSKNQLSVNDGLWVLNGLLLTIRSYTIVTNQDAKSTAIKVGSVNIYIHSLPGGPEVINKCLSSQDTVNTLAKDKDPKVVAILAAVQKKFGVDKTTAADLANGSFGIMNGLLNKLATKPALNFAYSEVYDFQKWQAAKIAFSSYFTFFIGKIPFDISGSLTFAADTIQKHSDLVRTHYEVDFGKNITFENTKWLEIKPAIAYIRTDGPLYKKEKTDSFAGSITPF